MVIIGPMQITAITNLKADGIETEVITGVIGVDGSTVVGNGQS
jgi:hypothetical protein